MKQEKKIRVPLWIYPSTNQRINELLEKDNCKSPSEYIEKAVVFYNGFISTEENKKYLPEVVTSVVNATVKNTENRIARLLFKLAVEVDMTMNIIAAAEEIDEISLARLRARCAENVSKTRGQISFENAMEFQREKD